MPIAGRISFLIPIGGTFPQSISPNLEFQLARDTINSRRPTWTMIGLSGDWQMDPAPAGVTQQARILIKEAAGAGVNAMQGVVTTNAGGFALVPNTLITANTRISLTWQDNGATATGAPQVAARVLGVSFAIQGTAGAGDGNVVVFWQLWEPAP